MSPDEVINEDLYLGSKQVNDWHREAFPKHYSAFDIDLAGVCDTCNQILYFCEGTTNPEKNTNWLRKLASDHCQAKLTEFTDKTPVFLFVHTHDEQPTFKSVSQVFPTTYAFSGIRECEERIHELRKAHALVCGRQ